MRIVMSGVLVISLLLLLILLVRHREARRGLSLFGLHALGAFVLLYLVNTTGMGVGLQIAVNPITLVTVGVLGVPGLAGLAFLKMAVL